MEGVGDGKGKKKRGEKKKNEDMSTNYISSSPLI